MIEISADTGKVFALRPGSKLALAKNNPMTSGVTEEYSLPLDIPRLPNEEIFGHHYRQSNVGTKTDKVDVTAKSSGRIILKGTAHLNEVDEDLLTVTLKGGRNDFITRVAGKTLPELPWHIEEVGQTRTNRVANMRAALSGGKDWYSFPVYNLATYKWWNEWDFDNDTFKNDNNLLSSIYPRLYRVIEYLFAMYGYTVNNNYFSTLSNLVMWNIYDTDNQGDDIDWSNLMPDMTVVDFISTLETMFGVTFFINSRTRKVDIKSNDTIITGTPSSFPAMVRGKKISKERQNGYIYQFENDDTDKLTDEPSETIDNYGVAFYGNKSGDLPNPTISYKNFLAEIKYEGIYYKCVVKDEGTEAPGDETYEWIRFGIMAPPVKSGNGEIERTVKAHTLGSTFTTGNATVDIEEEDETDVWVFNETDNVTIKMLVPCVDMEEIKKPGLRLLFYRGMDTTSGYTDPSYNSNYERISRRPDTTDYPQGSAFQFKQDGSAWGSVLELRPDGDSGLVKLQENWLAFLQNNEPTTVKVVTDDSWFESLEFGKMYAADGMVFLLDSVSGNFDRSGPGREFEVQILVKLPV
jgi:hypothetical protein